MSTRLLTLESTRILKNHDRFSYKCKFIATTAVLYIYIALAAVLHMYRQLCSHFDASHNRWQDDRLFTQILIAKIEQTSLLGWVIYKQLMQIIEANKTLFTST